MAGQFNKKELELLMGTSSAEKNLPGQFNQKEVNILMQMLGDSVNDTKKEGIMTAEQYKQGGDLNYVIEMMKNETDPDKLEELKSIIREMLGTTPYMSIRQDPVRKANEGGDAKEENPLRQFRDDYEMLIGFPSEVLREESKVMMELLDSDIYEKRKNHQQFKDLFYDKYAPTMKFLDSLSEEERKKALDIILSKRAEREIDRAEVEGVESLMSRGMAMADGGIVHLAPGGPVTKGGSTLKPSTYTKPFEDFLKDIGFTKVDEKTGKVRGSKGAFNKYLTGKGIKIGSTEATAELNKLLKEAGKRPYISVDMSQKGLGQSLIDEITGTEAGKPNVRDIRQSTANKIEEIRLDANDKFGRNPTKKKYEFIKDQITKFFPKVAGTTALAQFIAGRALGAASALMPTEMGDAELYDEEGIMKLIQEQKENK